MSFIFSVKEYQEQWESVSARLSDLETKTSPIIEKVATDDAGEMQNLLAEIDLQNERYIRTLAVLEALYDIAYAQEIGKALDCDCKPGLVRETARGSCADVLMKYALAKHRVSAFEKSSMQLMSRLKYNKPSGQG